MDADKVSRDGFWSRLAPDPIARCAVAIPSPIRVALDGDELVVRIELHDAHMRKIKDHYIARLRLRRVGVDGYRLRSILRPVDKAIRQRRLRSPLIRRRDLQPQPTRHTRLRQPLRHAPIHKCRAPRPIVGRKIRRPLESSDRVAAIIAALLASPDLPRRYGNESVNHFEEVGIGSS